MKIKKILSAVLSAAMCLSIVTANVSANEGAYTLVPTSTVGMVSDESVDFQAISEFGTTFRLEDVESDLSEVNTISSTSGTATYAANSAPVAGLVYRIINPDSLSLEGYITTDTIIYWLWNDGENVYTYDPDGDEIVNYYVGGINDYIIGTITLDGEMIGFATQVTDVGEHELRYYVEDSNGNYSTVTSYSFVVKEAGLQVLKLAGTEWSDSKYVRWRPTGSNSYMYHTLYSRLGGDICVYKGTGGMFSTYTNHNGTYRNVAFGIIAADTVFLSAETWSSATGNPNSYLDPVFQMNTPRGITLEEIKILLANNYAPYIVYNPNTLEVIDFFSPLNPLIAYGWSEISYTVA